MEVFILNKIKVLVVDCDVENSGRCARELSNDFIEVIGIATDGQECIEMMKYNDIDAVLTELVLPMYDGYAILNAVNSLTDIVKSPKVFIMSKLMGEAYINKAMQLGALYYFFKPCNYDYVGTVIKSSMETDPFADAKNARFSNINEKGIESKAIADKRINNSIDEKIAKIFISVGIPAHIKGYQFLRAAIKLVVSKHEMINNITKQLYPGVAEQYDTSASKVERAIRHAIEVAWNRGKLDNINKLFGFKIYNANEKPTNGEFIALIADKLMVDNNYQQ